MLQKLSPGWLEKLSEAELEDIEAELQDLEDQRCEHDPLYWVQNCTLTENPQYAKQGLEFKSRFPKKSYFVPLFKAFATEDRLFVPKTREMLTSWCAMIWAVNRAQWHQAEVVVQTESEDKAKKLLKYAKILYENQDDWLQKRHPLQGEASALSITWQTHGQIFGIPSGETKIRVHHPTIYIMDEAAFLPGAEGLYNAAHPVAQQIIAISSAGPGWFGNECTR